MVRHKKKRGLEAQGVKVLGDWSKKGKNGMGRKKEWKWQSRAETLLPY